MISSCKLNKLQERHSGIYDDTDYDLNFPLDAAVPRQQLFEMNEYHKTKLLADQDSYPDGDHLNFIKNGRRSVKRGTKSSEKNERTILPVRIRGNYDRHSEEQSMSQTKYKESNSFIDKYQNHPMIINQMNDHQEAHKLTDSYCTDVLTPKSVIRDIKPLRTATSYYPSNSKIRHEEVTPPLFQIEKSNNYLKKLGYQFNITEDPTEKVNFGEDSLAITSQKSRLQPQSKNWLRGNFRAKEKTFEGVSNFW